MYHCTRVRSRNYKYEKCFLRKITPPREKRVDDVEEGGGFYFLSCKPNRKPV